MKDDQQHVDDEFITGSDPLISAAAVRDLEDFEATSHPSLTLPAAALPAAITAPSPHLSIGWLVAFGVTGVAAVVILTLYVGLVAPLSAEVAELSSQVNEGRAREAALRDELNAVLVERDRLTAANAAMSKQVEQQEGTNDALARQQEELDASLRRQQDELEKERANNANKKKPKRKKRR
jgi:flagellar biosynthesis/type III secretory pathway M-ring protein FliF/YscJ